MNTSITASKKPVTARCQCQVKRTASCWQAAEAFQVSDSEWLNRDGSHPSVPGTQLFPHYVRISVRGTGHGAHGSCHHKNLRRQRRSRRLGADFRDIVRRYVCGGNPFHVSFLSLSDFFLDWNYIMFFLRA